MVNNTKRCFHFNFSILSPPGEFGKAISKCRPIFQFSIHYEHFFPFSKEYKNRIEKLHPQNLNSPNLYSKITGMRRLSFSHSVLKSTSQRCQTLVQRWSLRKSSSFPESSKARFLNFRQKIDEFLLVVVTTHTKVIK